MSGPGTEGRIRRNLRYARTWYAGGGLPLLARRAGAKAARVANERTEVVLAPAVGVLDRRRVRRAPTATEVHERMRAAFDAEWYLHTYGVPRPQTADGAFAHYMWVGAQHGFSPGPDFDELAYRAAHPAVRRAIERGLVGSGLEYHLRLGEAAGRSTYPVGERPSSDPLQSDLARLVVGEFDAGWYAMAYADVAAGLRRGTVPSALWHYVRVGCREVRSPNAWFDETWYLRAYQDVAAAVADGSIESGFVHFLAHGRAEGRRTSPHAPSATGVVVNELAMPIGIDRLDAISAKLQPVPYRIKAPRGRPRVNFVVPTLNRQLMFAGYIAALNFLGQLIERGWDLRILVVDDAELTAMSVRQQFADHPLGALVFQRAQVLNLTRRTHVLDISKDDSFIAYSMWAAYQADRLATAVDRRFVFFLQEFEPIFHPHDGLHAFGAAAYAKPHFALFNSEFLRRYFERERLGVYAGGKDAGDASSTVFEHTLAVPSSPRADQIARPGTRRLLFYSRPEAHAGRNLFEIGVTALRDAVEKGVFEGDWVFQGVGSLATETTLPLGAGYHLAITPRLSLGGYAEALRSFDVGLSLQYSPHPGVVHFEMAASGLCVVTNTYSNRSCEDLKAVSANLVPVEPRPDAVVAGLAQAVAMTEDVEARVRGAAGAWPRRWSESFNEDVMQRVEAELR